MPWREHSSGDTVPRFSTILQFTSELRNNWGTGLPCIHPSWIYCTGEQHKVFLFPCLFSCLSALCLQLLLHGSYLSYAQVFCPSTLAQLRHLFSGTLTAPFSSACRPLSRSRGMPLLSLTVPQTLTFLSSIRVIHFTPYITCYIITSFSLYCACFTVTSNNYDRRLQLFTWTSGDVTVTAQNFVSL